MDNNYYGALGEGLGLVEIEPLAEGPDHWSA